MSKIGKEYKLAIRIAGVIDKSFETSLVGANAQLRTFKQTVNAMDADFTRLDKGFNSIMKVGRKTFSVITTAAEVAAAAIAAVTVASLAVGSEFESAFAGVKKTVEATDEEYAKLRADILQMSKEIPASAKEIAGVMEIAGQLGIATNSLTDFTRTMIDMGESTNLEASVAADALARFANVTNMANYDEKGISNYSRLGSVIVDLGNNFATTEEEIVAMATNLAATGDMVGLSQAQIMALATAMSATGIKAEKGGSAMSKLIRKMQIAVETGSDSLVGFASVSNMTASEFSEAFKTDAISALSAFIMGLNDTERNGKSAIGILTDMKLSEVRLSDVILRLANAQGEMSDEAIAAAVAEGTFESETVNAAYSASLLGDALKLANKAWEENTALSIEAGKRYETFGSQLSLMKNAFVDLGIATYDEASRAPALGLIQNITESVNNFTADGLHKTLNKVSTTLPTVERKVKNAWKVVSPFFKGVIDFGKWNIKNPEAITGVFIGLGTALAAYKIASTIVHIVSALMAFASMNPVTLGIMGVVAALGLLAGGIAAYKVHEQGLVNQSLADHFGSIALSMKDIEGIAQQIVHSDNLSKVKEALSQFDDLDTIAGTIDEYTKEIDKLNWKVSIGMELTEDENEAYKQSIADYVKKAQDFALQSQYAVSLNITAGFEGTDLEGSDIVTKINNFYQDKYDELSDLGTKLNEAVTEAFNDGLLEIDEVEKIANIQRQMANIQEQLATGEFQAHLQLIQSKYSGEKLDADSFQNLQAELSKQVEEMQNAYDESYVKNVAAAYSSLSGKDLQSALDALEKGRLQNEAELQAKSLSFQINTILSSYDTEVDAFRDRVDSIVAEWTGEEYWADWKDRPVIMMDSILADITKNTDKTTANAIQTLLKELEPSLEQAEELKAKYKELGLEIPEGLNEALADADLLGGLTVYDKLYGWGNSENREDLYKVVAGSMANDESLAELKEHLESVGWEFPDAISTGVVKGLEKAQEESIRPAVEGMYAWSQEAIDEYYKKGFDTSADVRIQLNPSFNNLSSMRMNWPLNLNLPVDKNAEGGIVYNKELSWIAENVPETIIPHERTPRAIDLWEKTGRILGMDSVLDKYSLDDSGSTGTTVEYSPTLQFYGEAPSKKDLEDALEVSQDKFEELMEQYFKKHGRVSFG